MSHELAGNPVLLEDGRAAMAHTTTFTNQDGTHQGGEQWFFRKVGDEWRIKALYYGLPGFSR